jgi:hypothetical protein
MEEEMEELYAEGLATRGGPESCVAFREGRGEALTGVRAGRAIEPRNVSFGVPTLFVKRKATSLAALSASRQRTSRGLRTRACAEPPCARTGRARAARPPGQRAGRSGNAEAVILG